MRRVATVFLLSWAVSFWFALLLFGVWRPLTLMASGAVGLAAAGGAAAATWFGDLRYGFRLRWLASAAGVPLRTFVDFGILTRELAHALAGRRREGVFRAKPFEAGPAGWRAFVGLAAGYTPNAYVVEIDPERGVVLVHDLVPSERSEAPA